MLFRKKRRMIDMTKSTRRGVVTLPKEEIRVPQASSGYLDLANTSSQEGSIQETSNVLDFMQPASKNQEQFSTESEGYNKREVDAKITELDNKVYRLEQRIELLEKKAGVETQTQNNNLIGW